MQFLASQLSTASFMYLPINRFRILEYDESKQLIPPTDYGLYFAVPVGLSVMAVQQIIQHGLAVFFDSDKYLNADENSFIHRLGTGIIHQKIEPLTATAKRNLLAYEVNTLVVDNLSELTAIKCSFDSTYVRLFDAPRIAGVVSSKLKLDIIGAFFLLNVMKALVEDQEQFDLYYTSTGKLEPSMVIPKTLRVLNDAKRLDKCKVEYSASFDYTTDNPFEIVVNFVQNGSDITLYTREIKGIQSQFNYTKGLLYAQQYDLTKECTGCAMRAKKAKEERQRRSEAIMNQQNDDATIGTMGVGDGTIGGVGIGGGMAIGAPEPVATTMTGMKPPRRRIKGIQVSGNQVLIKHIDNTLEELELVI